MPVAECPQQAVDLRPALELAARPGQRERRAHLLEVLRAAGALGQVRIEARALAGRQRALEIVRDELDELPAGEILHTRQSARAPLRYNPSRAESQATWRARSAW